MTHVQYASFILPSPGSCFQHASCCISSQSVAHTVSLLLCLPFHHTLPTHTSSSSLSTTGKGFWLHETDARGKPKKGPKQLNPEALAMVKEMVKGDGKVPIDVIQKRIAYRFVNEAAFCLQDGIISTPGDGDIGAVFGVGFPPFMGGPFRMLDMMGVSHFVDTMQKFREQYGEQFAPAQILVDYAKENKRFHPK